MSGTQRTSPAQIIVGVILAIAVAVGIFLYMKGNNTYSPNYAKKQATTLVNDILKQNNLKKHCVEIKGFSENDNVIVKGEFRLTAVLDSGEEVPIKFTRGTKDGNIYDEVEILQE